MTSIRDQFPLRLFIGTEDVSFLLDDGATFSNVDPGGFEAASFPVPRDMPATIRGLPVLLTCGLSTVWEGRVSQPQRSLGSRTLIQCEGNAARLKDLSGSMVFVDRDLTRWGSPSYTRQAALASGNKQLGSSQVAADPTSNTPALIQSITDSWSSPWLPINEAWYDSGPDNLIAEVHYDLTLGGGESGSDSSWNEFVALSSDANLTTEEISSNLHSTSEQIGYFAPATAYRFALLQHINTVTNGGLPGGIYNAIWRNLAVYGNHGLTGRGSDPVGFYPSDIVGWAVSQAPTLQAGTIQQTDASGLIVPHYVQYLPVTLDTIVGDMATIQGWFWGVWESPSPLTGSNPLPRLDFLPRPAPGAFTAFARRSDCDTLDIREDLSNQYNTAVVNYTDAAGTSQSVTVTADNPILDAAGIPTRTVIFQGGTMVAATAALFAAEALALTNTQARVAGTANFISPIDGGVRAAWTLRAGVDRIRFADTPATDAWGAMNDYPISRVEATIGSNGITANVELGTGANLIESLQARLAAATALAGQGL